MVLLSHLEAYVGHFTQGQLRTVILPQVSRGRWVLESAGRSAGEPRLEGPRDTEAHVPTHPEAFGRRLRKAVVICRFLGKGRPWWKAVNFVN